MDTHTGLLPKGHSLDLVTFKDHILGHSLLTDQLVMHWIRSVTHVNVIMRSKITQIMI